MRLYLHGRSPPSVLLQRLENAKTQPITSVLLSGWDDEELLESMEQPMADFLRWKKGQLEEVTLQNCRGDLETLLTCIFQASPKHFILRFDKQENNGLTPSTLRGIQVGAITSDIREITIRGVTATPATMDSLCVSLPGLRNLRGISFQSQITLNDLDKQIPPSLFAKNAVEQVQQSMINLLLRVPYLQSLELTNCHIPDAVLVNLLKSVQFSHSRLTNLALRGNGIDKECLNVLGAWLGSKFCTLKSLDMSWQRLSGSGRSNGCLDDLESLADGIHTNKSLRTLRLSENKIFALDVKKLAKALSQNTTLQRLELRDCQIQSEGLKSLVHSLPKFHLKQLDLGGSQRLPGNKVKSAFFRALQKNFFLQDLILPGNVECERIDWVLEWNRAGRQVVVHQQLPLSVWPDLLARANRIGQESYLEPERHAATAIFQLLRDTGFSALESGSKVPNATSEEPISASNSFAENEEPTMKVSSLTSFKSGTQRIRSTTNPLGEVELEWRDELDSKPRATKAPLQPPPGFAPLANLGRIAQRQPFTSVHV